MDENAAKSKGKLTFNQIRFGLFFIICIFFIVRIPSAFGINTEAKGA